MMLKVNSSENQDYTALPSFTGKYAKSGFIGFSKNNDDVNKINFVFYLFDLLFFAIEYVQ